MIFNLSDEIKLSYEIKMEEVKEVILDLEKSAAGRSVGDLKEFWHFGQDLNTKYLKKKYVENIKVKELKILTRWQFSLFGTRENCKISTSSFSYFFKSR